MQNYCFCVPRLVHVTLLLFLWLSTGKVSFKTTAFLYPDWYTSRLSCSFGSLKTKPVSKLPLLCTQTGTPNTALVPLVLYWQSQFQNYRFSVPRLVHALLLLFYCSFGSLQAKLVSKLLLLSTQTGTCHASLVPLTLFLMYIFLPRKGLLKSSLLCHILGYLVTRL